MAPAAHEIPDHRRQEGHCRVRRVAARTTFTNRLGLARRVNINSDVPHQMHWSSPHGYRPYSLKMYAPRTNRRSGVVTKVSSCRAVSLRDVWTDLISSRRSKLFESAHLILLVGCFREHCPDGATSLVSPRSAALRPRREAASVLRCANRFIERPPGRSIRDRLKIPFLSLRPAPAARLIKAG